MISKNSKWIAIGLTAAMTFGCAGTVFAAGNAGAQQTSQAGTTQRPAVTKPFTEEAERQAQTQAVMKLARLKNQKADSLIAMAAETTSSSTDESGRKETLTPPESPDMSTLELPEDFVPFDEDHVPDGKNAPAKGELKPIEFDEDGKMISGQKPDENAQPPMNDKEQAPQDMNTQPPMDDNGQAPQDMNAQPPMGDNGQGPRDNGGQAPAGPQNFAARM